MTTTTIKPGSAQTSLATRTAYGLSIEGDDGWGDYPTPEAAAANRWRWPEDVDVKVIERVLPVAPPLPAWASVSTMYVNDDPISGLVTAPALTTADVRVDARQEFTFTPEGWSGAEPCVAILGERVGVYLQLTPEQALAVADALVRSARALGGVR